MTNGQREAIDRLNRFKTIEILYGNTFAMHIEQVKTLQSDLGTVLSLIKEQQGEIELIKEYVHQEIVHYTETIKDYKDDDKEGNKHYIEELKEEREHWRDIEKILQNKPKEELYMNWWRYGLYE